MEHIVGRVDYLNQDKGYGFLLHGTDQRYFFHAKNRREIYVEHGIVKFVPANNGLIGLQKNQLITILETAIDDQERLRATFWIPRIETEIQLHTVVEILETKATSESQADNKRRVHVSRETIHVVERITSIGTEEECKHFVKEMCDILPGELVIRKVG